MGRKKAAELRRVAYKQGWLDKERPLVDDATLASVLGNKSSNQQCSSLIAPYQDEVIRWHFINLRCNYDEEKKDADNFSGYTSIANLLFC